MLITRVGPTDRAWSGYMVVLPTGTNPVSADDFPNGFPAGTINFAVGQRTNNVHFYRNGNTTVGPDETILLNLSETRGGPVIASAMMTIQDDDNWVRVVSTPSSIREGTDGVFILRRSVATEELTLS